MQADGYSMWSTSQLVARITELERQLKEHTKSFPLRPTSTTASSAFSKKPKIPKAFNPSKYTTRLIALKFAYLGAGYNGFEHHVGNSTPLPTIEEELWKALVKTRLIFPPSLIRDGKFNGRMDWLDELMGGDVPVDWDGAEYSKCGRTDRGVSAFGQVVGVRVRSARPVAKEKTGISADGLAELQISPGEVGEGMQPNTDGSDQTHREPKDASEQEQEQAEPFHHIRDELPYISLLNKVLPPTIRVLAWCPSPPSNFSARYSCKERLYKYFFTNPAYLPTPGAGAPTRIRSSTAPPTDGWLDIEAMRQAANYLVGTHDFRNFCKVDPSKQLTMFARTITHASIDFVGQDWKPSFFSNPQFASAQPKADEVADSSKMCLYAFTVRGSAFLWHQVRCMAAILFLVGQGLEAPTVVRELLDVAKNPCRPAYDMASDKPLVLWACTFSKNAGKVANGELPERHWDRGTGPDELEWVTSKNELKPTADGGVEWARQGTMATVWREWRAAKMNEVLAGQLMDLVASHISEHARADSNDAAVGDQRPSIRVFAGDDEPDSVGKYIPVMQKEKLEPVEVINARYLARKAATQKNSSDDDSNT